METFRTIKQFLILSLVSFTLTACGSSSGSAPTASSGNVDVAKVAKETGLTVQQVTDTLAQQDAFSSAAAAQGQTNIFTNTSSATTLTGKTVSKQVDSVVSVTTVNSIPGLTATGNPPPLTNLPMDGLFTIPTDTPVNYQLTTFTGKGPYTFTSSNLPTGLSLSSTGVLTGALTGGQAVKTLQFTVIDSKGTVYNKLTVLSISINQPLAHTTLPAMTVGVPVSIQLVPENNYTGPYVYSGLVTSGVSVSKTGLITGTPSMAGNVSALIFTTDKYNNMTSTIISSFVKPPLVIQSINGPTALFVKGVPANMQLTVPFGTAPYTFSNMNMLAGLSMDSKGLISGAPTSAVGMWSTFDITDGKGVVYKNKYLISNTAINQPFGTYQFPAFKLGQPVSFQLYPSNNWTAPYRFVGGAVVPGVTISSTGFVSGTPNFLWTGPFSTMINTFDKNNDIAIKTGTATVTK